MRIAIVTLLSFMFLSCTQKYITLDERLSTLDAESIDTIDADTSVFEKSFKILLKQPLDHNNPDGPFFTQKLYLSYVSADKPLVVVTEGYQANRNYTTELARYLDCNQIIIEHRFFGESVPEEKDWKYLDTYQAASDHHRVIELFKEVISEEIITTGISKGGQTVMFHSYYYPDDADIRVPYVAPLNFGPEDSRIYTFLDSVGTDYCREKVFEAQKLILENRDVYYPMMLEMANKRGLEFNRVGGSEKAFELSVLEYDFAYWQWGRTPCDKIILDGDPADIFRQFFRISGPDYFSDSGVEGLEPFFYQALTEIGYYGYNFDKFEGLLEYVSDGDMPEFAFAAPQGVDLIYNYELMKKVDDYIDDADNFIFIYGMQDTWSATAVQLSGNSNSLKILKKGGDHISRINNLPEEQREKVLSTLKEWLDE